MKFAAFLLQQEARLLRLYQSGLPRDQILRRRPLLFEEINADYARLKPLLSGLERFDLDQQRLNNAVLLNYLIYFHDLDRFAALERMHQGNAGRRFSRLSSWRKASRTTPSMRYGKQP